MVLALGRQNVSATAQPTSPFAHLEKLYHGGIALAVQIAGVSALDADLYKLNFTLKTSHKIYYIVHKNGDSE